MAPWATGEFLFFGFAQAGYNGGNVGSDTMSPEALAQYLEATGRVSQPWLLVQLRLLKLQQERPDLPPEVYMQRLQDIHQDLMLLGEWWRGREAEVFGSP